MRLSFKQAAAWRAGRHHLTERARPDAALDVVSRIAGLHAQVMSSAELSLHARVDDLDRAAVPRMLWEDRSLYKTWAMRGTLHLLPARERGLWQGAFATLRHFEKPSWLKGFKVTAEQMAALRETVAGGLRDAQLSRQELADLAGPELGAFIRESWGSLLKPSAFRGELCFAPSVAQQVRFTHPDSWLEPAEPREPEAALREVVRRYLGAYGPAAREDLARWWGWLSTAQAGRLLEEVGEAVDVEGTPMYLLPEHVEEVAAAEPSGSLRLLPAFDPYMAGASRGGHGIFPVARRDELYRQAGWLTPVILLDGVVAGCFRYDRGGKLELAPWRRLPKRALQVEVDRFCDAAHRT